MLCAQVNRIKFLKKNVLFIKTEHFFAEGITVTLNKSKQLLRILISHRGDGGGGGGGVEFT